MIVRVADIDRAIRTDNGAMRAVEPGIGGGTAVAVPSLAAAGNGRDNAARAVDTADRVVLGIDDQQAAVAVERHLLRGVEDGARRPGRRRRYSRARSCRRSFGSGR